MIFLLHIALSVSSPALSSRPYFSNLVDTRLSILFSVVLSSWYIRPQHFPQYVFAISPHHMQTER